MINEIMKSWNSCWNSRWNTTCMSANALANLVSVCSGKSPQCLSCTLPANSSARITARILVYFLYSSPLPTLDQHSYHGGPEWRWGGKEDPVCEQGLWPQLISLHFHELIQQFSPTPSLIGYGKVSLPLAVLAL